MDIITILILPIHEHKTSSHFCVSASVSFHSVLLFSVYRPFTSVCVCVRVRACACVLRHSLLLNSLQPFEPQGTGLLCPWDFSGKNTGVGCCFLLQGIFLTQRSNLHLLCLLHCRQIFYPLSHRESFTSLVKYILRYFIYFLSQL